MRLDRIQFRQAARSFGGWIDLEQYMKESKRFFPDLETDETIIKTGRSIQN